MRIVVFKIIMGTSTLSLLSLSSWFFLVEAAAILYPIERRRRGFGDFAAAAHLSRVAALRPLGVLISCLEIAVLSRDWVLDR